MSRSTLFALLLVLLLVTFIVAADTTASPSSAEIIVQTEKQQQPNNVNNVNTNTPAAVESNKQTQAAKEETITVEDGKKEEKQPQETAAATSESAHKQEKKEVAEESSHEGLVDAWLERPFSLLNAINKQLERNSRMFRRSLWDDEFEDAFDEDDMYDNFFGGNSLFDSVFNTRRRRIPSLFDSLRRRRASNNLYRRPAFYLNRLFRDNEEQESHKEHHASCGCGKKQQDAAVEPVKQQDAAPAASTDVKAAKQESVTVPVLKRVKSEWNEDKDSYKIKLNIPEGVYTKDQIKIQVKPYFNDKEMIIISGENKEKQSSFEKSFVFQKAIDSDKVKAKFENTVLNIEVAKKPHVDNVKQIAIE